MHHKASYIAVVFVVLLTIASSLVINIATSKPEAIPAELQPLLPWRWPLAVFIVLSMIALAVWQHRQEEKREKATSTSSTVVSDHRQDIIKRVRKFWITDFLVKSLHEEDVITLGLKEQPDAVEYPSRLTRQEMNQPERLLLPNTRITDFYENTEGALLILGEPGSGKTTLLLELTRKLLKDAEENEILPIPIVFNLSSWTDNRKPLADWLIDELNMNYLVPRELSQAWVNNDKIMLLLDGLGEVAQEHRRACIDTINAYRKEHGWVPIVICSRSSEYLAQSTKLLLHSAVVIQPLTEEQITANLSKAGKRLEALEYALQQDVELRALAKTPLMLSVLTLTYLDAPIERISVSSSIGTQRRQVFEAYVQRMLPRRSTKNRYTPQSTIYQLAWLAKQMTLNNRPVFYIEWMQPTYLPRTGLVLLYAMGYKLFQCFTYGLGCGLGAFMMSVILVGLIAGSTQALLVGTRLGVIIGVIIGVIAMLFIMLIIIVGRAINSAPGSAPRSLEELRFFSVIIVPSKFATWSWKKLWSSFIETLFNVVVGSLLFGLTVFLGITLFFGLHANWLFGVEIGLRVLFLLFLISLITNFLTLWRKGLVIGNALAPTHIIKPNQGMWNSAYNGVIGLIVGSATALIFLLGVQWISGISFEIHTGLIYVLLFGLLSGLGSGGFSFISHIILRLFLYFSVGIPIWNYSHFLDYAAERRLLCKIGGGYIFFFHPLLRDYFVSKDNTQTPPEVLERRKTKPLI